MKKTVKTLEVIGCIALAAVCIPVCIHVVETKTIAEPRASKQCVILQGFQVFDRNPSDGTYIYTGIGVYCSSSSSNAPTFPAPTFGITMPHNAKPMAEAIAESMNQGFRVDKFDSQTLTAVMIKD